VALRLSSSWPCALRESPGPTPGQTNWNPGWNLGASLFPFDQTEYSDAPFVKRYGNNVGDMLDMSRLDYEYR
jgi:hypothetical protein